jgi:phospholipase/lecithinase/hemolysin
MSRRLAEKWGLPFIVVKDELQKLIDKTDVSYVCYDGVHPTCNGHEVISRVVYEELKKIL